MQIYESTMVLLSVQKKNPMNNIMGRRKIAYPFFSVPALVALPYAGHNSCVRHENRPIAININRINMRLVFFIVVNNVFNTCLSSFRDAYMHHIL
jgi:hypothetical protein